MLKLIQSRTVSISLLNRSFSNLSILCDASKQPKRPASAFASFIKDNMDAFAGGKGMKAAMEDLSSKWKELDAKQKETYAAKYAKDIEKYKSEMEKFKNHLGPEGLQKFILEKKAAKQAKKDKALKKLHKAQKDPNYPKKPASSFILFSSHIRATRPKEVPHLAVEQSKFFSSIWKSLSEQEKKKYQDEFEKSLQAYYKELEAYKKKHPAH